MVSSLGMALNAQQSPSGYPDQNPGMQTQSTPDCSDPAFVTSPECSRQTTPLQNPQSRFPQAGTNGASTPSPNINYSDTEQMSRQASPGNQPPQPQLRPEPLTEFQKFVASTTGQILPIYGARLFRRVPSTFAPLDMTPVPPDFVVGPGDEVRIRVWGQLSFQANVRVDRSGDVYLPQVGPVHVANLPFSELDTHLRSAIGRVFHNFDLTVDLGQIRSIQVYFAGEARQPGVYTVSSLSTLVDALFAAGGPSTQGSLRRIELRRGGQSVTSFDLYGLLVHGDKSKDVKLLSGDVIFISPVGPQAAVTGSVRNPAIYEMLPGESLAEVIADAGGVSAVASGARVSIERIEGHSNRYAMEVAYDQTGLATPLTDGDLVHVFSIAPQYTKTVVLRGNTVNPGRYAWHPGMRISELIPDKDSLVTRNYWWKRAQLGLPAPEFEPIPGFQDLRQPADNQAVTMRPPIQEDSNSLPQSGMSDDQSDQSDQSGSQDARNQNMQQRSRGSLLSAQQRSGGSSLGAQQSATFPGVPRAAQRTSVKIFAPDIDWNYAVIERIDPDTLKTTLIPFDLGKLVLQHDASQDLELKSGDMVSVFSEADIRVPLAQQTKLVTLDGEFVHAGTYTVQPDETLRQLIVRAGGITPKAYLYGSEFTRESVRAAQQARVDEYARNMEMRIQRGTLALAGSSGSSQDLASGTAAQSSERDLLTSLRQIRASGRIVLAFEPDTIGTDRIPDIEMENGDRFVVPPVPAVVNVVGAVYNQNSFLYARGRRTGQYLHLAGGPNRDADKKHSFVIRANGDVLSRDTMKEFWGNEFANLRLNPGDTVVVPEKTFKPSALRGVLEWSQLFSQLALGAAAVNVIK
jgi:protein involved in polysaccharide export with SLBB domain